MCCSIRGEVHARSPWSELEIWRASRRNTSDSRSRLRFRKKKEHTLYSLFSVKSCSVIRYVHAFLIICIHICYLTRRWPRCITEKKTWLWVVTRASFPLITSVARTYMHTNGLFEEWMKRSSFEKLQQNHLFSPKQHSPYDKWCFSLMNNSQILSNQVLKIS